MPAPIDPILAHVAADQRLTGLAVVAHAKPIVLAVMTLLIIAILAAAAIWARGLAFGRDRGDATGPAQLRAIAAAGPLLGFFAAAYGLMDSCIGIANVRPVPSLSILAPGLAEAFLAVALGLLAAAVATLGRHHLLLRAAQAAGSARAGTAADAPLARAAA